jgi:hypothetical protein
VVLEEIAALGWARWWWEKETTVLGWGGRAARGGSTGNIGDG